MGQSQGSEVNWELLKRLPETHEVTCWVLSLTDEQKVDEICELLEGDLLARNVTQKFVRESRLKLELLLSSLPPDLQAEQRERVRVKNRWTPYINDTGNCDYTGRGRDLG